MQLQMSDVILSKQKSSWISRTISWFQKSGWSHTFLVNEVTALDTYITETTMFQLCIGTLRHYLNPKNQYTIEVWRKKDATYQDLLMARERGMEALNKFYGYLQLLWNAVRVGAMRLFKKRLKMITRAGVTCVENTSYGWGIDTAEQYDLDLWVEWMKLNGFELIYRVEDGVLTYDKFAK